MSNGTMEFSEQLNELAEALTHFQSNVPDIPHTKDVKYKGVCYSYAPLSKILSSIRKPLSDAGLSITQGTETHNGAMCLTTMLMHKSGQWIRSRTALCGQMSSMKDLGSAMTYSRRYALSSILGIAADEDVDEEPSIRAEQDALPRLTGEQVQSVYASVSNNKEEIEKICRHYGVASIPEIPAKCWTDLKAKLGV